MYIFCFFYESSLVNGTLKLFMACIRILKGNDYVKNLDSICGQPLLAASYAFGSKFM